MNKEFSALELLKFAISIEEQGVKFYDDLVKLADDQEIKGFMQQLSDDEKQHAAVFQKIYDEVATSENLYDYLYDYDIDILFRDYAEHTAFNREVMVDQSVEAAILVGVDTEKLTIDYYESLLPYAKPKLKEILDRLIEEEMGHYQQLMELLK